MRQAFAILAASALAAGPAYADNNQVQRGPVPGWVVPSDLMPVPEGAGGLLFVRRNDNLMHLDASGEAQHTGYRIRILHANALQLGNISIAWNPAGGAPTVHAVRVHRGGEAIDVLKDSSFEILRREGQLEAASLDGILTAILRVPDLRVGDELEVSVTTRFVDPVLGANSAGLLFLAPEPPPGRFRLGLSWTEGQEPKVRTTPDMAPSAERRPGALAFRFDNPAVLAPPADAPPRYSWQRIVEYSDFADWNAVSRQFAPLFGKAATLGAASPLRQEVKRIASAHAQPLERARAALDLVQQQVRYVYVGLNGGNLRPATADETWQRRYGDCKGKTALLLALLGELGIEAEPVLVSNAGADDGLDARLPSPRMFDHVLVRARIAGSAYWLDGTLPPVAEPSADPVMPYRWVLPVTSAGSALEHLPWRVPEVPDQVGLYEIDARAGFDKPARIISTTILRGVEGLQQQAQLSALTPAQLLSGMRQQMGSDTWQDIDDVKWRYDRKARASVLTISGTGIVDWDDDGAGSKSLTLPGGGFNPPDRRARPADQNQDAPYYSKPEFDCRVTTVRLPSGTQAAHWSFGDSFDQRMFGRNYHRAFELRDGAIRMVRGSRVEQPEIDAKAAARDNARIASFDNSMALIYYEPRGRRAKAQAVAPVPATYEIDWTAEGVPCLSSRPKG